MLLGMDLQLITSGLVAVIGAVVFVAARNANSAKAGYLGLAAFGCGLLVFLQNFK